MDTYTWELTKRDMDFYGGDWKRYEDSYDYSDEEMKRIKDLFVKGNTVAFHEIVKLGDDGITLTVTFPHNEEYSVYFKNGSLQVDSNNGDEILFGTPKTIKEIREVVEYVTTSCDYLPINCIQSIKKGTELVYETEIDF
jgi:hypothetical protein